MANFIILTDYDSTIHSEILNAIVRADAQVIEDAEDEAIEEVKGYLTNKYDVEAIFSATGNDRHKFIIQVVKDIVVYNLSSTHNPQKFSQIRQNRYDQAIDKLQRIQSGKYAPDGLPLKTFTPDGSGDTSEGGYLMSSNKKRDNHL